MCRSFKVISTGHSRSVSGIIGLLLKEHFPGMVEYKGREEPAYTFAHYAAAPDTADLAGRDYANKAERVKAKL